MDDDTKLNYDHIAEVVKKEIEDTNDAKDEYVYCSTVMRNQVVWRNEDSPIIGKWSYNNTAPGANFTSKMKTFFYYLKIVN